MKKIFGNPNPVNVAFLSMTVETKDSNIPNSSDFKDDFIHVTERNTMEHLIMLDVAAGDSESLH